MHVRSIVSAKLQFLGLLVLSGCGNDLNDLSDSQLQERAFECLTNKEQTPGGAISCENYRRECQRRRDMGRYVC